MAAEYSALNIGQHGFIITNDSFERIGAALHVADKVGAQLFLHCFGCVPRLLQFSQGGYGGVFHVCCQILFLRLRS